MRVFGRSRLVQSTIVVPILGYVILFNANFAEYFNLIFDSSDNVTLPGRLYWLYFGFCFLSAGSIVFAIQCPREVKRHGAAYDFVIKQAPIMHAYRETAMREKLLLNYYLKTFADSGYDYVTAADTDVSDETVNDELANIRHSMQDVEQQISKLPIEDVMRDYFELLEESRPTWRRVTFLCYAVGVATLSVPTIHTFLLVAISLAEKLVGR